eukprot:Skav211842  [mRNA]  locus=scaffold305:793478:797902:+ [translate_table: standard]
MENMGQPCFGTSVEAAKGKLEIEPGPNLVAAVFIYLIGYEAFTTSGVPDLLSRSMLSQQSLPCESQPCGARFDVSHRSWPSLDRQAPMDVGHSAATGRGCFAGLLRILTGSSPKSEPSWLLWSFCDEVLGGGASLGSLYAYLDLTEVAVAGDGDGHCSGLCEALLLLRPTCRAIAAAAKVRSMVLC